MVLEKERMLFFQALTLFPSAKVERLDFDTARTRTAYERIIADFEKGSRDAPGPVPWQKSSCEY